MSSRIGLRARCALLLTLVACLGAWAVPAAHAAPGDVLVLDRTAAVGDKPALARIELRNGFLSRYVTSLVDPVMSKATAFAPFGSQTVTYVGPNERGRVNVSTGTDVALPFTTPAGVITDVTDRAEGEVYATVRGVPGVVDGSVIAIEGSSIPVGSRFRVVSSGDKLADPNGLVNVENAHAVYVVDTHLRHVVRVDTDNGGQTVVSSGRFGVPVTLTALADGDLLVADNAYDGGGPALVRVDTTTGAQTPVLSDASAAPIPALLGTTLAPSIGAIGDVAVGDDGVVFFTDTVTGRVNQIELSTGQVTTLATLETPAGIASEQGIGPTTTLLTGPTGSTKDRSPTFTWQPSQYGATAQCRIAPTGSPGGPFTPCNGRTFTPSNLPFGSFTFFVRSTSSTFFEGPTLARTFTVDSSVADVQITDGPSGPTNVATPTFRFIGGGDGATFDCRVDGTLVKHGCASPFTTARLTEGAHRFEVRSSGDDAGATRSFSVDTAVPDTVLDSGPAEGSLTNNPVLTFKARTNPTGELLFCKLDTAAEVACDGGTFAPTVGDGPHTVTITAGDVAGNRDATPVVRNVTVDATAPDTTIAEGPSGPTRLVRPTFRFTSDELGARFTCRLDEAAAAPCNSGSFTPASDLAERVHTFTVFATDAAGNSDPLPATRTFVVDVTPPDTRLRSGLANDAVTRETKPRFTYEATETRATFACRLDSQPAVPDCGDTFVPATPLGDGQHTVEFTAVDEAGNADPQPLSIRFTVDTRLPVTRLDSSPAAVINRTSASFAFSSEQGASFRCAIDTTTLGACGSSFTATNLLDAEHTFRVQATDLAGNVEAPPLTYRFTVDTRAPSVTITDGPEGTTGDITPQFAFSSTDGTATFRCAIDSTDVQSSCASPFTSPALPDGSHAFRVQATDPAGNRSVVVQRDFVVDAALPATTIDSAPPAFTNRTTATFEFSSRSGVKFRCSLNRPNGLESCESPQTYASLADGAYTFRVEATDAAGNVESPPQQHAFTVDTRAPDTSLTESPANPTNVTLPTFRFAANEANAGFTCKLDSAAAAPCDGGSFTPARALAPGSHAFAVFATDPAGNADSTPASRNFTVDVTPPNTLLQSGLADGAVTRVALPTFRFTTTEPLGATFACTLDADAPIACDSGSYTPARALADGPHTLAIAARDAAGNLDPTPVVRSFTVDTTQPVTEIQSGPAGPTNRRTAEFAFRSESGASFRCSIGDPAPVADCSSPFAIAGLADGEYTFYVRATDAAGNVEADAQARSFRVDTVAPDAKIDGGPPSLTNDRRAVFAFSSEADAAFRCSLDGADFGGCTSPLTADELADGVHAFRVVAIDAAGNVSRTAQHDFTVDATAPVVSIDAGPEGETGDATPAWAFSSEDGASFSCSIDGAAFAGCASPFTSAPLGEGAHTFRVRASDAAGNVGEAQRDITVSLVPVDTTPPVTTIVPAQGALTNDSTPSWSFTSEAGASFKCSIDSETLVDCASPFTAPTLRDAEHTFRVQAIDAAGNAERAQQRVFTVDTVAPETSITNGPPGVTELLAPTFLFSSPDGGASFRCAVDGAAFAACASPFTSAPLALGAHAFRVQAVDAAGNADGTPALLAFEVRAGGIVPPGGNGRDGRDGQGGGPGTPPGGGQTPPPAVTSRAASKLRVRHGVRTLRGRRVLTLRATALRTVTGKVVVTIAGRRNGRRFTKRVTLVLKKGRATKRLKLPANVKRMKFRARYGGSRTFAAVTVRA